MKRYIAANVAWVVVLSAAALSACAQQSAAGAAQLLRQGKLAEARAIFESILQSNPADADARMGEELACEQMAIQARAAGNADEALRILMQANQQLPNSARLLYDLGMQEQGMHLAYDAEQAMTAAEKLAPTEPNVQYAMARIKMDRGDLASAQSHMEAYLKQRPNEASGHFGLGMILLMGLQFDAARAEFQRSVELQPVQTESWYELGDIALKQQNYEEALMKFQKVLERDARHGGALEGAGEASFKQKNYEQALEFLQRAVQVAPKYAPSHYYLGLTFSRLGRKDDATRELELSNQLKAEEKKLSSSRIQQTKTQP